jgi:hypothetical protein
MRRLDSSLDALFRAARTRKEDTSTPSAEDISRILALIRTLTPLPDPPLQSAIKLSLALAAAITVLLAFAPDHFIPLPTPEPDPLVSLVLDLAEL